MQCVWLATNTDKGRCSSDSAAVISNLSMVTAFVQYEHDGVSVFKFFPATATVIIRDSDP